MENPNARIQVSRDVAREAAQRILQLGDDDRSAEFLAECQSWRDRSVEHEEAWRRAVSLQQKMGLLPAELARDTLQRPDPTAPLPSGLQSPERRRHISTLIVLIMAGPSAYLALSSQGRQWGIGQWHAWISDYTTRAGQQQQVELPDGSRLHLNTASSVSIHYSSQQRLIVLHQGEIQITTAKDVLQRPFSVQTSYGVMTALGTRFIVRHLPDEATTKLSVQQGAVAVALTDEITDRDRFGDSRDNVVRAGQFTSFDTQQVASIQQGTAGLDQWQQGVLIADQMPLAELIKELARYRTGWLRCDPDAAQLKITGVFRLDNTDQILNSLPHSLPVEVVYRSPYWITVKQL